jgi:methionyl-tRNA formyltransferase
MQMDAGLDTGAMLHKCAAEIGADETSSQLHDRLAALGAEALMQALPGIADGTLKGEAQDDALACYADKLVKSEGEIDWAQPAEAIARQVRGLNAWPVAETTLDGAKLRVWLAEAVDGSGAPGQVVAASREGVDVGTGDGLLRITSLQLPGKRALSAADFVNSRDIVGAQLGGQ